MNIAWFQRLTSSRASHHSVHYRALRLLLGCGRAHRQLLDRSAALFLSPFDDISHRHGTESA